MKESKKEENGKKRKRKDKEKEGKMKKERKEEKKRKERKKYFRIHLLALFSDTFLGCNERC